MTREPSKTDRRRALRREASGVPRWLEVALVEQPEPLQEPLRALLEIISGSARLVAARLERQANGRTLGPTLDALGRDLRTLSELTRRAAVAADNEEAGLRLAAFDFAERLATLAKEVPVSRGGAR